MAVYTPVSVDEVAAFLRDYNLGTYRDHQGITQGVENTNYHLMTDRGRAILTIFEKRTNPADLPFVFGFTRHLGESGIAVPDAYPNQHGALVGTLAGKPASIIRYLDGAGVDDAAITPDMCAQLGRTLAHMHLAAASFTDTRANPVGPPQWRQLLASAVPQTDLVYPELQNRIAGTFADYAALDAAALPRGAVHADAFPDNVFFDNGRLSGVIDFYFACTDFYAYDVAMTVNAWCFNTAGVLVPARLAAFAAAYESVRPLQAAERAAFNTLHRAAALRIFATRLYDWVFTPAGAQVTKKDPLEYAAKLKADCTWP